jgi:hypothetical protein
MNGLLGHAEVRGDLGPGPSEVACTIDLERFELFHEPPQGCDCAQSDGRVSASCTGCNVRVSHLRQYNLSNRYRQVQLTNLWNSVARRRSAQNGPDS